MTQAGDDTLLSVRGLTTRFVSKYGTVTAVNGLDLDLRRGEILALVGESGCGKSVSALSIMRLVAPPGEIEAQKMVFDGRDLMQLSAQEMTRIRGAEMAMIFQQPKACLNPVKRIGHQIAEQFQRRRGLGRRDAWEKAVALLARVGIPGAQDKAFAYPHELSGGQAQRVMIAIALALDPQLLIADEPTTALDVTIQAQVLKLLAERCRAQGTALILVTHDLGVVAQTADRVAVMYAGKVVEQAPVEELFANPSHPYTRGLLNSIPGGGQSRYEPLAEIPGRVKALGANPVGCGFAERCLPREAAGLARCFAEDPDPTRVASGHHARCWLLEGTAA